MSGYPTRSNDNCSFECNFIFCQNNWLKFSFEMNREVCAWEGWILAPQFISGIISIKLISIMFHLRHTQLPESIWNIISWCVDTSAKEVHDVGHRSWFWPEQCAPLFDGAISESFQLWTQNYSIRILSVNEWRESETHLAYRCQHVARCQFEAYWSCTHTWWMGYYVDILNLSYYDRVINSSI